ncbi:aspartyl protease family protein [Dyella monticola]|nr:aspartyl protease family protein [Dyella monticola]
MKMASGGAHWDLFKELDQDFAVEQGGQRGRCTEYQDLRSGRYASYCTLAELPNAQGYDGTRAWFMDEKSMVSVRESIQSTREAATDTYLMRNGWFHGASVDPAHMTYVGQRTEAGKIFDVVDVVPEGGLGIEAWIDARSHLLDRVIEDSDDGSKQTTWYSDYRPVDGVMVAFKQRQGMGDPQYDETLQLQHVALRNTADNTHFAMPSSSVHDADIDGGAASTTVSFTPYAGLIMVGVSIDGSAPMPFLLDTGGLNLLTPDAAQRLGLKGAGNQPIQGVGTATQSMQTAQVKSYRVGNVVMRDQPFVIVDLPRLLTDRGAREPIAGIIGYELLRRFVTRIDYDDTSLTFTKVASFHGEPGAADVPIVFNDRTPQVVAKADGNAGTFNLDTGDVGELTLFAPFATSHNIKPLGQVVASGARGAGGKIDTTEAQISSFSIGPFTVLSPRTSFASPAKGAFASSLLAGNIGHGILSRFVVTFDYEHRQLYLQQGRHFAQSQPGNHSGLGLDRTEHDAFQVVMITPGSPSERAQLRVGDRVTAIDGIPVSQLGLDDVQRIMKQPQGTRVQVSVMRGGKMSVHTLLLDKP